MTRDKQLISLLFGCLLATVAFNACKKDNNGNRDSRCQVQEILHHVVKDEALEINDLDYSKGFYTYDSQGRVSSYRLTSFRHPADQYTVSYTYAETIIERYESDSPDGFNAILTYRLDARGRIVECLEESAYRNRTTTFEYNAEGYLAKRTMIEYERSEKREDVYTYTYAGGNLTNIELVYRVDGQSSSPLETVLSYSEQLQNDSFYFIGGYTPALNHSYGPLRSYFGGQSKNLIASIREFTGFGYSNFTYAYEVDDRNNVRSAIVNTDSNGSQVFRYDFVVHCP